jgi:CheY-like chemotaxis protein
MADWLLAACRGHGLAAIWQRRPAAARVEGATAAIFDAAELDGAECDELRRFVAAVHPSPAIALLSFPRIDDRRRALSAGATAVLSKPVAMADLFWQVDAAESRVGQA